MCTNSCDGKGYYNHDECIACELINKIKQEYVKSEDNNQYFKKWVNNKIYNHIKENYYNGSRENNFKTYDDFCDFRKKDSESTYNLCNLIRSLA